MGAHSRRPADPHRAPADPRIVPRESADEAVTLVYRDGSRSVVPRRQLEHTRDSDRRQSHVAALLDAPDPWWVVHARWVEFTWRLAVVLVVICATGLVMAIADGIIGDGAS